MVSLIPVDVRKEKFGLGVEIGSTGCVCGVPGGKGAAVEIRSPAHQAASAARTISSAAVGIVRRPQLERRLEEPRRRRGRGELGGAQARLAQSHPPRSARSAGSWPVAFAYSSASR